ncbi:MAG: class II aldolase/adducin family protein [Anaerolineales bacterium]|nr:class II aldolase/adducin family protein [Anaerolineales bacterium]MCX7608484.1 class II aldolase/adducin family protein [Anaerolineales bacterium]MDW8226926.1 class II aldolase/adducin family protein [Anaerolineales bacterium]
MLENDIYAMRKKIANIGRLMYARMLTDAAGGNISVRMGDVILMTPRYAGSQFLWDLAPENVLVLDLQGNKLEGEGEVSREIRVHRDLLNKFYPDGTAVVHGHARNALVFCAQKKPIPSMLDSTDKFGQEIGYVPGAPAHTQELADQICAAMATQLERVRKQAAIILAPRHGVFVFAKNLEAGYDALDRLENTAYCALMGALLK